MAQAYNGAKFVVKICPVSQCLGAVGRESSGHNLLLFSRSAYNCYNIYLD